MVIPINAAMATSISSKKGYFIDANVLKLLFNPIPLKPNEIAKAKAYSDFISRLINQQKDIYVSALNFQEVLHLVETTYYVLYCTSNGDIGRKEYRQISDERSKVKRGCESALKNVSAIGKICDCNVSISTIKQFISGIEGHHYEPIDYIVKATHLNGANIITDDRDFRDEDEICVFTYIK